MKKKLYAAAAILVAGCASAPATYNFDNSAMIAKSYDDTWSSISRFFTSNNIQIKTIEKDSGLIYAERSTQRPSTPGKIGDIGDCGSPGMDISQVNTVQLNVFAQEAGPQQTEVTVNTTMTETRCFGQTCHTVTCNSTGRLERNLIEYVRSS